MEANVFFTQKKKICPTQNALPLLPKIQPQLSQLHPPEPNAFCGLHRRLPPVEPVAHVESDCTFRKCSRTRLLHVECICAIEHQSATPKRLSQSHPLPRPAGSGYSNLKMVFTTRDAFELEGGKAPPPLPAAQTVPSRRLPDRKRPASAALATHGNRPQPLWQPPVTAFATACGAHSEAPSLLTHPFPRRVGLGPLPSPVCPCTTSQTAFCKCSVTRAPVWAPLPLPNCVEGLGRPPAPPRTPKPLGHCGQRPGPGTALQQHIPHLKALGSKNAMPSLLLLLLLSPRLQMNRSVGA